MKSNYGPVADTVIVRWKDGVFIPGVALCLPQGPWW